MRGGAINIGGAMPRSVSNFLDRMDGRGRRPAPEPKARTKPKFLSASGKELKRPALQGFACYYNKAFFASGRYRVMKTGAFIDTLYDFKPKSLLFDHDANQQMGSISTGLEFANCLEGLAFRMPLDGNPNASAIFDAVMSNTRACVSIGAELIASTIKRTPDGIEYDYCTQAGLTEISLVPEGAVENTYSKIVDLDDEEPNLWIACRSNAFASDKNVANMENRVQRIIDLLAKLKG